MKNNYLLSIIILFISITQIHARTLKPTVKVFQLDTNSVHTCDTIHNRIIIKNDSIDIDGFIDTLTLNYPNQVSGFRVVPIYGSWLSRIDSFGYTKIAFNAFSDSIVLDYSYYIPCSLIIDGESSGNLILKDTITDKRKYTAYPSLSFVSTIYNVNTIGYANLYIVPSPAVPISYSHLTAFGTVGEYINITIVLESNSKLSTDFDGTIQFIDEITNGCDMYEIDSIKVQIVNPILLSRTSISSIYYAPPILPSSTSIFTLPVHLNSAQGEYIEIGEVIHIISDSLQKCIDNCSDNRIQSLLTVNYGCDTNLCKNLHTNAFIYRGPERPIIRDTQYTSLGNWDTACFQNSSFSSIPSTGQLIHHTHIIKNKGLSTAYNVNLILRSTVRTSEIVAKSWVDASYNGTTIHANQLTYYIHNPSRPDSIMPICIESFKDLMPSDTDMYTPIYNMSWVVPVLNPNDSIIIHFDSYRCCPSDTNKYVGNFTYPEYFDTWGVNGYLDSIDDNDDHFVARDECGDDVRLQTSINQGIVLTDIDVGSILGPAHLTGHNNSCDTTLTQYYDIPLGAFCNGAAESRNEALLALFHGGPISGQLEIEVITDMGLNSSTSVSHPIYIEGSVFTGSNIRYATTATSSYGLSGGNTAAYFNVDSLHADTSINTYHNLLTYLNGAYLRIPITPCCNGLPTPSITVRFYLRPNRGHASTCVDCKIPIGSTTRMIQLHCPGCITPGIIADNCKVRRETVGYPDLNNNGIADGTTPYSSIDAITRNRYAGKYYMPSDEMSLSFEGYGTDGIDSLGFSYQSLQNYWQSRHATDINYPTKYTDLYIFIKNECAATDEFNWTVMGDTLHWSRPGGLSGMTLLAPYLVHGADYLFYRVPIRAIGDSIGMQDYYTINMRLKACGNGHAAECNISTYLWWSGDSTMPFNSFDTSSTAGKINTVYRDSVYATRQAHMSPGLIYYCEGHGDMLTAFRLKREYTCIWQDKGDDNFSSSITCNKKLINKYNIKVEAINENLVNLFTYEYRPLALEFTNDFYRRPSMLAPNYLLQNITNTSFYTNWNTLVNTTIKNTTIGSITSYGSFNNYHVPNAISMVVEGSLPIDSTTSFVHSDERSHIEIMYNFEPITCGIPDSTIRVNTDSNYAQLLYTYCPSDTITDTIEINKPFYTLTNPNPKLQLRLVSGPVAVYSTDVNCFTVRLINTATTSQLAENLWVHALSPNLGGSIVSITEVASSAGVDATSIVSDSADGLIANVNHLTRNQYIDLQICFDVNTCITPDSIQLIFGYSCIEGMNCFSDTLAINLEKAPIQIVHYIKDSTISIPKCGVDTIECRFRILNAGEIDHLQAGIDVPLGVRVLSQQATYRAYMMPGAPSDTLAMNFITTTIIGGRIYHFYEFNADTALHGTPSLSRSELEIVIRFTIGSCIATSFKPNLWLRGISYCNDVIVDSIKNIRVATTASNTCPIISFFLDSIKHASCNGSHDGYIRIKDTMRRDGLSIVDYQWSTGDTGLFIDSLVAGTYTVTAIDGYGCADTASFTVNALTNPIQLPTISYQPYTTCDLRADSIVIKRVIGSSFNYTWLGVNTSPSSGIIGLDNTIRFNMLSDSNRAIIKIIVSDSICLDTLIVTIEQCCLRTERLISNTSSSLFFTGYPRLSADTILIVGEDFRINGLFIIDTNTIFRTCKFYMEKNSKIIMQDSQLLFLDNVDIVACDTSIWQGIVCKPYSKLYTKGLAVSSRIYDADTAIICMKNAEYHILNTNFNRNMVCISVHPNTTSSNPSTIINSNLFCHFETPSYYGNVYPDSSGTMWYPYRGAKTNYGVFVRNNMNLQIGDSIYGIYTRNKIEDMYTGIYSINSGLQVKNIDFFNMRRYYQYSGFMIEFLRGNGIEFTSDSSGISYVVGLHVQNSTMDSMENAGVYLNGRLVFDTIEYNKMTKSYFGVLGENLGNTTVKPNYSSSIIRNNIINYGSSNARYGEGTSYSYKGIYLNACKKVWAIITNNIITSNINSTLRPLSLETGINISGTSVSSKINPRFNINDNKIYNGRYGIYVQSLTQPIDTMPSLPLGGPPTVVYYENSILSDSIFSKDNKNSYIGIYLQNANNINIGNNYIKGTTLDITSRAKSAIKLVTSKNNRVFCNAIDSVFYGFFFQGACNMKNRLYSNNFGYTSYHIFGNTSPQIDTQQVIDDGTISGPTTFHNNKMNQKALIRSINISSPYILWYEMRTIPTYFYPSSPSTTTLSPIGISYLSTILTMREVCTTSGIGSGGLSLLSIDTSSDASKMMSMINTTNASSSELETGDKQMSEEYIYDVLKNKPELLEFDDSLKNYYEIKQDDYVGTIDAIKENMSNEDYASVESSIEALEPTTFEQEADKIVYSIQNELEQRASFICTNEELNALMEVANYCPIRYGASVYLARTLINTQKGYEAMGWDDEQICIAGVNYKIAPSSTDEEIYTNIVVNENISIFPNPANQYIEYKIEQKDKEKCSDVIGFVLQDIRGVTVKKSEGANITNSGKIDTSIYPEGLYFIYFICSDNTHVLYKFVINR
ncbi:MAG: T9SS type A sorting domain-containing protein [Bacteroidota bacterium]